MNRYYYVSDNLDALEHLQDELEHRGVDIERIHVLSDRDSEVSARHVNDVDSLAKKDLIRYGLRGALVGLALALTILVIALATGLMATIWAIPILFLAAIALGFCTWEGGLIGAHLPSRDVQQFQRELSEGRHVLFVDAEDRETAVVDHALGAHPEIMRAGTGKPEPNMMWRTRQSIRKLIRSLP